MDKGPGIATPAIKCSTQEKEAGKSLCLYQLGLCKKTLSLIIITIEI